MLIAATLIILVLGALAAAAFLVWQVTPGPRSRKALAAMITVVTALTLGVIFIEYVAIGIIVTGVSISALGVATGRLSFWQGVAAGLGAPIVAYGGLIVVRVLHGIAFPGTDELDWRDAVDGVASAQLLGVEMPLLLIAMGTALLATACAAAHDARPFLVFIGAALVLGFGVIELNRHWDLIVSHLREPRTWFWIVLGKAALFVLFSSLIAHGRRNSAGP